jgi:hypothetical protein
MRILGDSFILLLFRAIQPNPQVLSPRPSECSRELSGTEFFLHERELLLGVMEAVTTDFAILLPENTVVAFASEVQKKKC